VEIKWLEDFLCLVDSRNFSRSAEQRSTTQPAFSRRIKALEDWVGATLFDRSKQPISLTESGERFRPIAEEILRRLFQGREEIRQIGRNTDSTISFSATHSLSLNFFPEWIRGMEERSSVFLTRLDTHQVGNCVQDLVRGDCQFMLCHTHPHVKIDLPDDFFTFKKLAEDKLLPVSKPDEAGNPMQFLPGSIDKPLLYLGYTDNAMTGRAVEYAISRKKEKAHLNCVFESHLAAVLKTMIKEGRGMAWLPESQLQNDLESKKLVLAGDESWAIPLDIRIFRSRDTLPDASEKFWDLIIANAEQASY